MSRSKRLETAVWPASLLAVAFSGMWGTGIAENCRNVSTRSWVERVGGCENETPPGIDLDCEEIYTWSAPFDYEDRQFTETVRLCFANNCDPGRYETDVEGGGVVGVGTMWCEQYTAVPLPNADPELCPCPCEVVCSAGLGSVYYKMWLGRGFDGKYPHYLWIHQDKVDARLFTPKILEVPSAAGLKVYRLPDHSIRQVRSASSFADVVVISPTSFRIDLYHVEDVSGWKRDAAGFLVPEGDPYRSHTFADASDAGVPRFEAVESSGAARKRHVYEWNGVERQWSLRNGGEGAETESVTENYDAATGTLVKTWSTVDPASGLSKSTVRVFRDTVAGRQLLSTEKRLGGRTISVDRFEYFDETAPAGSRYHLKARLLHDGSWERFAYDEQGRLSRKWSPWKDSPVDSPDEHVVEERYEYPSIPTGSPYDHPFANFARIDRLIEGIPVSTTYRLQSRDLVDGGEIKIEEHAARAGEPFGSPGAQRTETRFFPVVEFEPSSGKLRSRISSDGTVRNWTYEGGDYAGPEGMPGVFVPRPGGLFTRVVEVEGTAAHPEGVSGRSLATVRIQSSTGKDLLVESRLLGNGSPRDGELLAWTSHAYDEMDRSVIDRDATGIIAEYRYNPCCAQLEWQRDRDGTETTFVRDANERVTAKIVKAPGRPEMETHYSYGSFGQILSETLVSGDLVQETKHEYDDEGELIATISPDGLVTRFVHDHDNHTDTTILPGGATKIETRYIDGQTKSLTGTAIVASHFDYGVDPGTGDRWTQTQIAKADGPRWTRSTEDALDRTILNEAPGHGEGVVLATHTAYDEKGRVIATQTGWRRPSVGADDEKGSTFHPVGLVTLQTYDPETGELDLSGQDVNGDNQLVPGQDRIVKTERHFEEVDGAWWEVSRQWSYPLELKGQPSLVLETRQRLTGLGSPHTDPALGVLVAETVQLQPSASSEPGKNPEAAQAGTENSQLKTDKLVTRSVTYRHRETGIVTTETTDPKGLVTRQVIEGGLVARIESKTADSQTATSYEYDGLRRRIRTIDPRAGASVNLYDSKTGRVIAVLDAEKRATRYAYYPADHPSAGRLATIANADGKEQHLAYTARGEQRAVWGASVQPLLYEYNEYGEKVGMRTFQTTPDGDPSLEEDKGARTAWHYHEPTGALLRKEYADGTGPEYAYTEAGQLKERQWARETVPVPPVGQAPRLPDSAPDRPKTRLTTTYTYDPQSLQLLKSTATDGTEVTYEYDSDNRLAKVTDATGTREFAYDSRGQILKESVTLLTGADTPPIRYEIRRSYTPLGQPESVHLVGDGRDAAPGRPSVDLKLDHKVDYAWNPHGQLASVTCQAGTFTYDYDPANPALLTRMTSPVHTAETTYEPHRNLITSVVNRRRLAPEGGDSEPRTKNQEPSSPPTSTRTTFSAAARPSFRAAKRSDYSRGRTPSRLPTTTGAR